MDKVKKDNFRDLVKKRIKERQFVKLQTDVNYLSRELSELKMFTALILRGLNE